MANLITVMVKTINQHWLSMTSSVMTFVQASCQLSIIKSLWSRYDCYLYIIDEDFEGCRDLPICPGAQLVRDRSWDLSPGLSECK